MTKYELFFFSFLIKCISMSLWLNYIIYIWIYNRILMKSNLMTTCHMPKLWQNMWQNVCHKTLWNQEQETFSLKKNEKIRRRRSTRRGNHELHTYNTLRKWTRHYPLPHKEMHALSRLRLTRFPSTRLIFHTTENILRVDLSCLGGWAITNSKKKFVIAVVNMKFP